MQLIRLPIAARVFDLVETRVAVLIGANPELSGVESYLEFSVLALIEKVDKSIMFVFSCCGLCQPFVMSGNGGIVRRSWWAMSIILSGVWHFMGFMLTLFADQLFPSQPNAILCAFSPGPLVHYDILLPVTKSEPDYKHMNCNACRPRGRIGSKSKTKLLKCLISVIAGHPHTWLRAGMCAYTRVWVRRVRTDAVMFFWTSDTTRSEAANGSTAPSSA